MPRSRSTATLDKHLQAVIIKDPLASAEAVGLRYVTDDIPGIRRQRAGKGFKYFGPDGAVVRDRSEIQRIDALAIPPAYKDVWICPYANGHLQATGRDARGRKQYRYHPRWRQIRDQTKFTRMLVFSESLPLIRQRIEADLARPGLPREKVLAAVVKLMEITRIRVGNEEYARTNQSFGLTTMQDEHVEITGSTVRFQFRGKSGVEHDIEVCDRRLARLVKRCQDLPGQDLFQYMDNHDQVQTIGSGDVNQYLQEITGQDFTAKDFRTWGGTVMAALELQDLGRFTSATQAKKQIVQAIKQVAQHLGNRPATCRKYYVHPAILDACLNESLFEIMEQYTSVDPMHPHGLRPEEQAVVALLKQQLMQEIQQLQAAS